jgi:hypothetical protein
MYMSAVPIEARRGAGDLSLSLFLSPFYFLVAVTKYLTMGLKKEEGRFGSRLLDTVHPCGEDMVAGN